MPGDLSAFMGSKHVGRGGVTSSCITIVLFYWSASSTGVARKVAPDGHL